MSATDRKRRQRLNESSGQAFFGFRFDAVALEDLLLGSGHLHPLADTASKGNIVSALTAFLSERVTGVTPSACAIMAQYAMDNTPTAPAETTPEVELVAARGSDGSYHYTLRLRPAGNWPVSPTQVEAREEHDE